VRRLAAVGALLAVAGCVTTTTETPEVGNFKGQPSAPIIARLGPPESQEATATTVTYRWGSAVREESAPVTMATVTYATGVPATVPVTTFQPRMEYCTLVLTADTAGRVTDLARQGNRQACAPLLDRLGL
jgi:hypothetical protein